MGYKTINGLMRHLRDDNNIKISGTTQKRWLLNTGYFHGYKGYRFFKHASKKLPFTSYDEIYATIQYDTQLKTLFYDKVMFIETAVKSIALECVLNKTGSENIDAVFNSAISSYKNSPTSTNPKEKEKLQREKLALLRDVHNLIVKEYSSQNPKITHFYNNNSYDCIPIWALFEVMMLGTFGKFLSCLTYDVRDAVSKNIGLNLASDTNRELVYKYIYSLKDLRNAVAHNDVVFDARFKRFSPSAPMKLCLQKEMNLQYVNFETIGNYVALVCYYMRLLRMPRREIKSFLIGFEKATKEYSLKVNTAVSAIVIHPDTWARIAAMKKAVA